MESPSAPAIQVGSLTIFDNSSEFDSRFPGLPVEDFEESPTAPGAVQGCDEPIDENTNQAGCFSPGDILPGLSLRTTQGIRLGCPNDCPMVVVGAGLLGNPTRIVGPNFFADSLDMDLSTGGCAVGMTIHNLSLQVVNVEVFGPGGLSLGSVQANSSGAGEFFGVATAGTPLTRLRIADTAETVDDIRLGGPETCAARAPALRPYGLAGAAVLLTICAMVALRRRRV